MARLVSLLSVLGTALLFVSAQCTVISSFSDPFDGADLAQDSNGINRITAATDPALSSTSSMVEDPYYARTMVFDYGFRDQKKPQMVFFGDSITDFGFWGPGSKAEQFNLGPDFKGWAVQLNDTLDHQAAMLNLAFKAGTNTKGFNQSMALVFEQMKPYAQDIALVNLAFGANDAVLHPGWLSTPNMYAEVLVNAVAGLRAIGIKNIMFTTPPPVGIRHPTGPDRINEWTYYYPLALQRIGHQFKVPVANIYDPLMKPADWRKTVLLPDQLHLTQLGNNMVHDIIWETIQRNFPDVSAAGLPAWYEKQHQKN